MDIALWALQVLLALAFLGAGFMKATQPLDKLSNQMKWINGTPPALVRFIGVAEILGGIGLILPAATRILTWLTPTAAIALAVVMVLAAIVHFRRNETQQIAPSLVLLLLTVIVAVGRIVIMPF